MKTVTETATFGGGCFWCLEASFEQLKGVLSVVSGYMGGQTDHPTYQQVSTGQSGHAEVVQITFDPSVITFAELLEVFFVMHDPTTLNRQGHDIGTQYRSVLFFHSPEQEKQTRDKIASLEQEQQFLEPIVTQVVSLEQFYPAENYHQGYFRAHPTQPYCQTVVSGKAAKVREKFADRLK